MSPSSDPSYFEHTGQARTLKVSVLRADNTTRAGKRSKGLRMEQAQKNFVTEGLVQIGPRADFFVFMDGEQLGKVFAQHSGVEPKQGEYTPLGRARVTVEWLEESPA